jgi:GNAT superfamily N-acetyltransferase
MTKAALALRRDPVARPAPGPVTVRRGTDDDVDAALDLHQRCSPEAVLRRFHTPSMRLSPRLMHHLLLPRHGFSLLAVHDDADREEVVAMACAAELEPGRLELGMLVRDDWQGLGIGSRLVRMVADQGADHGYTTMLAATQPDNHGVPAMVRRAGLPFTERVHWGLLELDIALTEPETLPRSA